jgi:hypothetical protein
MHQDQSRQEPELPDGIVRAHDSLSAFFTSNTNTDVSFLDHGNIVGTIANGQSHNFQSTLDHLHNSRFLRRTDTTA